VGRLRTLRPLVATLFVGAFAGYVVAALVGTVLQDNGLLGSGESAQARAYMIGLLERDPDSVTALRPKGDIVQRATEIQTAEQSRSSTMKPLTLTYLGGGTVGRISVHIYAVEMRASNGRDQFFPLALTIIGGKVVRSE
jgi:hypothetical protein